MPTIYVDRPFRKVVTEQKQRMERKLRDGPDDDVYVQEREALEQLLSDEAMKRIERKRERKETA